jgi:segregation and condensation protein B
LTTSRETSDCIDLLIQDEQRRDIGKAGIETLSIIAYKGNVTRKEIEYIRGVNSQFALRGLLIRGLIDKKSAPYDERAMVYSITTEALMHLGIKNIEELPEYDTVNKQLDVSNIEDKDHE